MRRLMSALTVLLTLLVMPAWAQRQAVTLVLMPGAGGASPGDFLVRNIPAFQAAGLSTLVTTSPSEAVSLIANAKAQGGRVVLVGMSLGSGQVGQAIASGARPDKLVIAAGGLMPPGTSSGSVAGNVGNPALLPPTLIVHHRNDQCMLTPPEGVAAFQRWAGGRVRVAWISGGGGPGLPCRLRSFHAFEGTDRAAAGAIIGFARSR